MLQSISSKTITESIRTVDRRLTSLKTSLLLSLNVMKFHEIKTIFKGGFGVEWNKKSYREVIESISKREEANWE